jgi:hypothetical protein
MVVEVAREAGATTTMSFVVVSWEGVEAGG